MLSVGVCSYALLQSVSVPTLPVMQEELATDQATTAWILTAFLLSASVATPILGRLGDSFGKRRMLIVSMVALSAGSVLAAVAPTIEVMLVARVIQGVGGGTIPLSFSIIRDELPEERIPNAISLISSLLAVGFAAGIVIAGPVADRVGFRVLFLLPALVAACAAVAARLLLPVSGIRSGIRLPLVPAALFTGWLVTLLLGMSQAPEWGWRSPAVLSLLASATVLLALWVMAERRLAVPLIDLRLMGQRGVWTANLVALLIGVAMFGSLGFLPQLNQTPTAAGYGFGASVTEAGQMMLPAAAATFLCGIVAARLSKRVGIRQVIVAGSLVASAGLLVVSLAHEHKWEMYVASGLTGLGAGLVFACLANAIIGAVPAAHTGVATGMNANIRTIGGTIGSALMGTIITANVLPSGYPVESGYVIGFATLAGVALLAGVAGTLIPASGRRATVSVVRAAAPGSPSRSDAPDAR